MREDEEGSITDANNVTDDTFINASISQRENSNSNFTGENLEKLDEIVNAAKELTINDAVYELNKAT